MKMLKIYNIDDYKALPVTKWNIKQPSIYDENRENPMLTGQLEHARNPLSSCSLFPYNDIEFSAPLDLILVPGVAFTLTGGRCGHGMGFYDKYFRSYFDKYPKSRTVLVGLAFSEQIVDENRMPVGVNDHPLDIVMTCDGE